MFILGEKHEVKGGSGPALHNHNMWSAEMETGSLTLGLQRSGIDRQRLLQKRKRCLHLHFGIYPYMPLLLMSVFSGIRQWQDVFESDPGTGQLEIRHCNPSERPAGQRPRLCPTWIQQVGPPIGLPLQSCRGAWTRKLNIKPLREGGRQNVQAWCC